MKCKTCGIEGHDSQGEKALCLIAVVARCERMELQNDEMVGWLREIHMEAMVHDLSPNLAKRVRDIAGQVAKYVEKPKHEARSTGSQGCTCAFIVLGGECPVHAVKREGL